MRIFMSSEGVWGIEDFGTTIALLPFSDVFGLCRERIYINFKNRFDL